MYAFNKIAGDKVILENSLDIICIVIVTIIIVTIFIIIINNIIHRIVMKVSLWRGLKDVRSSQCKGMQWDSDLPKVKDIIIIIINIIIKIIVIIFAILKGMQWDSDLPKVKDMMMIIVHRPSSSSSSSSHHHYHPHIHIYLSCCRQAL